MFSKVSFRMIAAFVLMATLMALPAMAQEFTQLRYVKTTDYGATWSDLTVAGNLATFAPNATDLAEFSATTTATNELCYVVILPEATPPGVYSLTGPTFTPVLVMELGENVFDVGYDPAEGRTDVGRTAAGDLIAIIWGHTPTGANALWANKSTDNGATWGTAYVAANEALLGTVDAANYSHMFHISDLNSNTNAFVVYQRTGTTGQDQYVLRLPVAGGMGTVTNLNDYAGHVFSYMFTASKPIAYDPAANALYVVFHNHDRSGSLVYYSNNEGASFTLQTDVGLPGPRYPSIALRPGGSGAPFVIWNETTLMPVGDPACVFYAYDEAGYAGGLWTEPDTVVCVERGTAGSTGSIFYVNTAYFWNETQGIASHNSWDAPSSGERLYTTQTTDGGVAWGNLTLQWDFEDDLLDAATMQNGEIAGGSEGVAYIFTAAKTGLTDLVGPMVSNMELLTDPTTLGPYVVRAWYDDNVGIDTTQAWINWDDPQVNEGAETFWVRDSAHIFDEARQMGWYYFTIPDTNILGENWAAGDTIDIYADGYDVSGIYGAVDHHQLIIVGTGWLGTPEPVQPGVATEFRIVGNYPNPFNPSTQIVFDLPTAASVSLKVFNTMGQQVAVLADNAAMTQGRNRLTFDGANLPTGMYYYRLTAGPHSTTAKMLLLK